MSSRINAVSAEARDLWVRLLVNADDHGYFHGDAQLVASACFPLQPNARKCEQLMGELTAALLIVRYESGGKSFLAMNQWYERPRSKPKYPPPPSINEATNGICEQLHGHENNCEQLHVSTSTVLSSRSKATSKATTTSAPSEISLDAVGWHGITDQDRKTWADAYPAVSLDGELAKAKAWVEANPKNRKSNWRRFLVGWFDRAQNRARPLGGSRPNTGARQVAL